MAYSRTAIFLPCLLLVLGTAIGVARMVVTPAVPVIELSRNMVDFGGIDAGETVAKQLYVRNRGSTPLAIKETRASCGCTRVELSHSTIPPGGSATLTVALTGTGNAMGKTERVALISNDPRRPIATVDVRCRGTAEAWFDPAQVEFGRIVRSELPIRKSIRFHALADDVKNELSSLDVLVDDPFIEAQIVERRQTELVLEVALLRGIPCGSLATRVRLVSHDSATEWVVMAYADIEGDYYAVPPRVSLLSLGSILPVEPDVTRPPWCQEVVLHSRDANATGTIGVNHIELSPSLEPLLDVEQAESIAGETTVQVRLRGSIDDAIAGLPRIEGSVVLGLGRDGSTIDTLMIPVTILNSEHMTTADLQPYLQQR